MTGSSVEVPTDRGPMPAYVAVPDTPPPWPGVVVVHDFTGMSHDLRAQADWLAGEGLPRRGARPLPLGQPAPLPAHDRA